LIAAANDGITGVSSEGSGIELAVLRDLLINYAS
jgi:hypothetical protein